MSIIINEDTRNQLVAKSKQSTNGGSDRFKRRLKSHVATSTKQYNRLDMNQLFKDNIITIGIEVRGETDNYLVKISYGGILDEIRNELKRNNDKLELRCIIKALIIAFNKNDVYIHCSCPDWKYRFNYWATKNDITSGDPELRPSNETNPHDSKGSACKHVLLVLSNTSWLIKVASVIHNYIRWIEKFREKLYANVIYPAIYNRKYEEPVQLDVFDDTLDTEQSDIDTSNRYARTKNAFKPGENKSTNDKPDKNQISMQDLEDEPVEEET